MSKDRRTKACPNADCDRNTKKYHYKSTDRYCTICGAELVFVCADCFKKISADDPHHIRCAYCEAKREDLKHNTAKKIERIKSGVANTAKVGADTVKAGVKSVAGKAEDIYGRIAHGDLISKHMPVKRSAKEADAQQSEGDGSSEKE